MQELFSSLVKVVFQLLICLVTCFIVGLTEHEILSQAFIFIFGGYETTSATLNFLLYNLATNPDALQTLHEEIDANLPRDVQYFFMSYLSVIEQFFVEIVWKH